MVVERVMRESIFIGFVVIKGVHIYAIWPSHICMYVRHSCECFD